MENDDKVVETNTFVKEPVDAINKKIDEINEKIVVLRGEKGSGRTTVMLNLAKESKDKDNIFLYQLYDFVGNGYGAKDFSINFFETLYELKMSFQLLNYIRDNKVNYDEDKLRQKLHEEYRKILYCINNYDYIDKIEYPTIKRGQYVSELLDLLRKDELTLMIDRFDRMEGCSRLPQEYLSKYFDMFDKVILVSDDENYQSSYPTIEVDYGKKIEIAEEILKKYLELKNLEDSGNILDINFINYDNLRYLFDKANGNLKMMKQIICIIRYYGTIKSDEDFKEKIKYEVDTRISTDEHIKKMYMNAPKPKFYI